MIRATKSGRLWDITPEEVERYRTEHLGRHDGAAFRDPAVQALRLEALRSPETKAKMRAAKLGHVQPASQRTKISAALSRRVVTPETRAKHRQRQLGIPKSDAHREAIGRAARTPEKRAKMSAVMVEQYLDGRRPYSKLERHAADLLLPHGFDRFPSYDGHAFDFGRGHLVVEVNGCGVHRHRLEKPSCGWTPYGRRADVNARYRAIAAARDLTLIELWACERRDWPAIVAAHLDTRPDIRRPE